MHIHAEWITTTQWLRTSEDVFIKICTSHFIVRVRKGFYCERELETEHNYNILTPTLMAVSVVSFSFSRAAQRPTPQGAGFLHCILSPTGLQTPSGVPRAPSAGCSFPYHILCPTSLIPNSSGPQGPPPPGFFYHILSATALDPNCLSSYHHRVIVQRPLSRPFNPWNGMFDRHQAEITVM